MANTVIGASVQVDFQSVGNMRKALKEANQELIAMQEQFGVTSQEAIKAAQKVAGIKDKIDDAREAADLFDPGKKFQALVNLGSTIASGFSAVQGAMALVGSESEDVQRSLQKVQGAMALAQGLSQLRDLGKNWKEINILIKSNSIFTKANAAATAAAGTIMKLFGVAVNSTSFAFKALKTAIISTGIGALIILIVEVIQWISSWTSSTDEQSDANEQLRKREEELKYTIEQTNKSIEKRNKLQEYNTQLALANAKAVGASAEQLRQIEADAAAERANFARQDEENARKQLLAISTLQGATAEELNTAVQNYNDKIAAREEAVQQENLLIANQKATIFQEEKSANDKLIQQEKEKNDKIIALREKALDLQKQIIKDLESFNLSAQDKELFDLKSKFEEQKKILEDGGQSTASLTELYEKQRLEIIDKFAKEEKKKREEFLNDINKLNTQIRLSGIKDSREKEKAELALSYAEQLLAIKNNENYNALEKLRFRAVLLKKQKLEEDALNEKFRQEDLQKRSAEFLQDSANEDLSFSDRLAKIAEREKLESQIIFESEQARTDFKKQNADARAKIAEEEKNAVIQALDAVAQSLLNASDLLGKNTKVGKVMAIAAATISMLTSAQKAYEATVGIPFVGPVLAPINAGLAIAAGIKNIKEISKVKIPGQGDAPAPTPPALQTVTPLTPAISPAVQGQAINADAINNLGNTALRAYVMNSDIQNNDQRNAYLQRNARIG